MKEDSLLSSLLGRAGGLLPGGLALPFKPDELYRVPTADGASIALGRYRPRGERRFSEPVLLCHGMGANRYSFDFDERYSLARHLARKGFESWVVELRGRGLAGPLAEATFDDQAEHDVGAALRAVLSTGAPAVSWVGHSKGGLALFAHLVRNPSAPVRAAVAIGSPFRFTAQVGLRKFLETIAPALGRRSIPLARLSRPLAALGLPPDPLGRYLARAAREREGVRGLRQVLRAARRVERGVERVVRPRQFDVFRNPNAASARAAGRGGQPLPRGARRLARR